MVLIEELTAAPVKIVGTCSPHQPSCGAVLFKGDVVLRSYCGGQIPSGKLTQA